MTESGREAIVTGVSRGLGEALARVLVERGFRVTGIGRSAGPGLAGPGFELVPCDLSDVVAIDDALEAPFVAIAARAPAYVCLVNNAAVAGPIGVLGRTTSRDIAAALGVNLAGPAALANLFCRVFGARRGERRIVNVSSGAATRPLPGIVLYSAAKCGLEMLTAGIAAEQGQDGIRAVSLRPGIIATQMQADARSRTIDEFPSVAMFRDFHEKRQLVLPDVAAARIATHVVEAPVEQGKVYVYAELGAPSGA